MMPSSTTTGLSSDEYTTLKAACRKLPPAREIYIYEDYIDNVLLTVLDFQMRTTAVVRAAEHYKANMRDCLRTHDDLKSLLQVYPDTKDGNLQLARLLWGYNLWTRVELLRRFVTFLESERITTSDTLRIWAHSKSYDQFAGQVKGMGFAIYKWLVMRQGVETFKPDLWIHRFIADAIGRRVSDQDAVGALESVAKDLNMKAYELDWSIWEYGRSAGY
jgi:hypothetical protein